MCKKSDYFIDLFWRYILQSDWLKTFWAVSQEQKLSQIWDLCRKTGNKINFHQRTPSVKINDQIFQYIQKTLFLALFRFNFSGTALSRRTSYGFLTPCKNLEKSNYTLPRKCQERREDGQTLFHRNLLATAGRPKNKSGSYLNLYNYFVNLWILANYV